tara:strand:+ start:1109 stop:4120 length:3012 start_codon:yes stop_codon:yes gene_type:complete
MAVNYLTGNEQPTAAKMNTLWAEVDTIAGKALDDKSCLLALDHTDRELFGQPFYSFTAANHTSSDYTTFRGAIGTGSGKTVSVSTHDQASYDTAAAGATITSTDTTNFYAKTADTLNLEKSLKAHTRVVGSDTLYLWEDRLPHPCKVWRYAVAEIIIGDHSGTFTFDDTWNQFNFFRIHNLTQSTVTINFGSGPHHTFTIAKNAQQCVRRDTVSSGYDSSYAYVWKVKKDDPRFLKFTSHDGSLAQTMEANNVTNPSWLYKFFDELHDGGFIYLDPHTWTDIGSAYQSASILPAIATSTIVGDLVYTRGNWTRAYQPSSGGSFTTSYFNFLGFSNLQSTLTAYGISNSTVANKLQLAQDTTNNLHNLAGYETNLFTYRDSFRVADLVNNVVDLETEFYRPPFDSVAAASPTSSAINFPQDFSGYLSASTYGATYAGHSTTLAQVGTAMVADMAIEDNQMAGTSAITTTSTTEGPLMTWTEEWYLGTANPNTMHSVTADNLAWLVGLEKTLNSSGRLAFMRYWHLNTVSVSSNWSFSNAGWPTGWLDSGSGPVKRHDRIFEGGRKVRRYGTKDSDGTHNDITADPVGVAGADFGQDDIEALTDTAIKMQCSRFALSVPAFTSGDTNKANLPIVIPDGASEYHENRFFESWLTANLADLRTTSPSFDWSTMLGSNYIRLNLLKEHFNDLATYCKKVKRIRTLDFGQVYFGETQLPAYNQGMFDTSGDTTSKVAPKTSYSLWQHTPAAATTAVWTDIGATISTDANLPNTTSELARVNEVTTPPSSSFASYQSTAILAELADVRWVTITNAMSIAASLGFKFRMVCWSRSLAYNYTTTADVNQSFGQSSSGAYVLQGVARKETGTPSSGPYPTPTLTGSNLTQAADLQVFYHANNNPLHSNSQFDLEHNKDSSTDIVTETSPSTRYAQLISESAITLHLYDTSVSGSIGTLAKQLVQSGSTPSTGFVDNGSASTATYSQGTHNLTPSSTAEQHRFALELAATTHSA